MKADVRHRQIEDHLRAFEFASLEDLSEIVDASISTVRRDLMILEENGVLKRTHGGARLSRPASSEFEFEKRSKVEESAKQDIAKVCAGIVRPGQSLFMDGGSTVCAVAKLLGEKEPSIVTNSLPIANLYASTSDVEIVLSGGVVYPKLQVMIGDIARRSFERLSADYAIMGAGGATEAGIMNSHTLMVEIQRAMIKSSRATIFCLDATKLGRNSFMPLCGWEEVDILITNRGASPAFLAGLKEKKVEVVLA